MIHNSLKSGYLTRDKTIIEATSGNTGVGLAIAAQFYGMKCRLYVPKSTAKEKILSMEAYGAIVEVIDGTIDDCIGLVECMSQKSNTCVWLNQYDNSVSIDCHYLTTSLEIIDWMCEYYEYNGYSGSCQRCVLVAAMGTTGTIMGCSNRLKPFGWKIIGVMPVPGVKIEGLKNLSIQRVPKIYEREAVDQIVQVSDKDAVQEMKNLAKTEGIMAGPSSGAALFVAIQYAKKHSKSKTPINVVVILPDNGKNYLSGGLWG
jgi:cysteine synthase